mmetsp:Transcript_79460/g.233546  ORF Transcript_79460/g.233546 Transcript_79460/m.233546 type:complete len:101 (-) Transcript_79460:153-455(-)
MHFWVGRHLRVIGNKSKPPVVVHDLPWLAQFSLPGLPFLLRFLRTRLAHVQFQAVHRLAASEIVSRPCHVLVFIKTSSSQTSAGAPSVWFQVWIAKLTVP